jgi:ribosomal protein S18 acetylase RimI-like enzyme
LLWLKKNGELVGFAYTEYSKWDSDHFGFEIGKIKAVAFGKLKRNRMLKPRLMLIHEVVSYALRKGFECIICRINTADIATIHVLESEKFQLMDILMTFIFEFDDVKHRRILDESANENNLVIRPFTSTDINNTLSDLKEIAQASFSADHFHTDPRFPKEKVDDLYAEWIYNCCCKNRANVVLIAQHGHKIAGFITCKVHEPQHYGVIELVAVHRNFRGRGIGSSLVDAALGWFSKQVNKVYVGTQITNMEALRLYQHAGFKFVKSNATFHRWL